jgi:hypothetical protein
MGLCAGDEVIAVIESREQLWARLAEVRAAAAVRAAAEATLRQHGANIRDLNADIVSLSLGHGWGRGARCPPNRYAVIAVAASLDDCPRAQPDSAVAGIPVFFAYR